MNFSSSTGFSPLPRTTLSEQLAKQLASRISEGNWAPGGKLPSEAELCKVFNVGRSSLREALTSLAFIGLIRIRAGGGSYVAEQPSPYLTTTWLKGGLLTSEKTLGEFVEARLILETEVVGLCAKRVNPEELREMELLVGQMKAFIRDSAEFSRLDLAFHLRVGMAAKNEVLNNILSSIREQSMDFITKSLLLEEGMEYAHRTHIKILEALRQHSPVKAQDAMRTHLRLFQRGYNVLFDDPKNDSWVNSGPGSLPSS